MTDPSRTYALWRRLVDWTRCSDDGFLSDSLVGPATPPLTARFDRPIAAFTFGRYECIGQETAQGCLHSDGSGGLSLKQMRSNQLSSAA
jgi:hypothetical protein